MYSFDAIKSESPYYQEVVLYYKTNPCPSIQPQKSQKGKTLSGNCSQHPCYNYHSFDERRRPVFDEKAKTLLYEPIACPSASEGVLCPNGDACKFAHTQNEINYHPLYYKTEPCMGCLFDTTPQLCHNYHSDEVSRSVILDKFRTKKSRENSATYLAGDFPAQKGFNLDTFKTKPCTIKGNHNPKVCVYYHFDKDRRRSPVEFAYTSAMCRFAAKNMACRNGDNCGECHNKVEQLYHPERYKKKFCLCHPHNIHKCEYGDYCSFAHSESEIKIKLLHNLKKDRDFFLFQYKTVYCPYIYNHDRNQCVYAHNPQDFRRDPQEYQYNPVQCPNWSQGQIFSYEEGGCPKQMDCENCHGWKELEYHPEFYKTKICSNAKNCMKIDCPFLHPEKEAKEKNPTQSRTLSMGMNRDFGIISPQKKSSFGFEDEYKATLYDQFKVKPERKKESHFLGPIKPPRGGYANLTEEDFYKENEGKPRSYKIEGSTRPNSNISTMFPSEEDMPKQQFKKKKKKQMSLQTKKEESKEPSLPGSAGYPKGKTIKTISSPPMEFSMTHQINPPGSDEKSLEGSEPRKSVARLLSSTKGNDSFESLQSYTIEKTGITPEKSAKFNNEQFRKSLTTALQKKGLDYTVPILLNTPIMDLDGLRFFSQKDFSLFPQIRVEDKEKIVMIIRKVVEEESLGVPINPLVGELFPTPAFELGMDENWANLDFLNNNTNLDFTKHPFN